MYTHCPLCYVDLFNCVSRHIVAQPITWQELRVFWHLHLCGEDLLRLKTGIRVGKKGDLKDFEHGKVAGAYFKNG